MIPKIIHFTVPSEPTTKQLANIENARRIHPDWDVRVWRDPVNPQGLRLAGFWTKVNSGAQLADLIRLDVVHRDGGFYLDSDFDCRRSLDPLRGYSCVLASEDGQVLTNAFFGAEPRHPAVDALITELLHTEPDWTRAPDQTTGPRFFARALKWRRDIIVIPRATLYPYNFNQREKKEHPWTYGVHQWDGSWQSDAFAHRSPAQRLRRFAAETARAGGRGLRHAVGFATRFNPAVPPNAYPAHGVICVRSVHGFKVFLVGEDASITPDIAHCGYYELHEERLIQKIVRGGDWAIDVGANVGMLTPGHGQRGRPLPAASSPSNPTPSARTCLNARSRPTGCTNAS